MLKKGSSIGANATIVCGNNIGEYALIGAGAVVKENMIVEPYQLVVGVPGKAVKKLPETILEKNIRWAGKYVKLAKIHKEHQSI